MNKKGEKLSESSSTGKGYFKSKKSLIVTSVILAPVLLLGSHEVSLRHFQDVTCVACHEMRDPIKKWKDSGTSKSHNNCAGCHAESGLTGMVELNKSAARQFFAHFKRDPNAPIKPPTEPLFLDLQKEPGYYSLVPNHRCFQCHDVKNHRQVDQPKIHSKLLKDISKQPCKDCHNHEMREGQKFYEKILPGQEPRPVQSDTAVRQTKQS